MYFDSSMNCFNWVTDIRKSLSDHSYLIFHPRGPNFLLSWTTAWKKASPKKNFFHYSTLSPYSNRLWLFLSSWVANDISILFLIPLGGALESMFPIYSMDWGNASSGIEVSHSLNVWSSFGSKVLWNSSSIIYSTILSRTGKNFLGARWQFSSTTHPPSSKH